MDAYLSTGAAAASQPDSTSCLLYACVFSFCLFIITLSQLPSALLIFLLQSRLDLLSCFHRLISSPCIPSIDPSIQIRIGFLSLAYHLFVFLCTHALVPPTFLPVVVSRLHRPATHPANGAPVANRQQDDSRRPPSFFSAFRTAHCRGAASLLFLTP
ncbi:hypothetical protein B0T26DRAFT_255499 [Lasiosphaeria miniovina]|uniref:Transmembrane protein n=1 Tax=Lasiosphaeria miniovina TaxID=1954250 RepID=A0AA40AWB7_9PEZI|nr:uncharacterized protein B0T26DRAFT_255499 [Lasiosphaeria miniovina]KAK0723220.1 hypothetical protein B0T26DRAFT_255499 [Lasiosphaeria miniovina]